PGLLMVSTIRFRSIKTIHLGWQRSYLALFMGAVVLAAIAAYPRVALVVLAYTYLASPFVGMLYTRARRHGTAPSIPAERDETPLRHS
ncbi:MAG TPA: hypothetical protein VFS57_04980, partial [Gemmatimonadaceae bacterium]|nr:hypothetical protein [Gemmatimonadaceae bacterium]